MVLPHSIKDYLSYNQMTGEFSLTRQSGRYPAGTVVGGVNHDGYVRVRYRGKKYMAHRLAWYFVYGVMPSDEIDHINGNPADNRICNLREADRVGNCANRKVNKRHSTGFKGVRIHRDKFVAMCGGLDRKYLGVFDTAEDAHAAYVEAASATYGEFARAA